MTERGDDFNSDDFSTLMFDLATHQAEGNPTATP
jgi:hypothetical protein